jgi:hypothetical protein
MTTMSHSPSPDGTSMLRDPESTRRRLLVGIEAQDALVELFADIYAPDTDDTESSRAQARHGSPMAFDRRDTGRQGRPR